MLERYKKLFTDTGLFAISNFGSKVLTFLLVPVYTSVLSTEEYGIADILTTTVNLTYPVLTLSIYDATLRFALSKKYNPTTIFSNSILMTGIGVAALIIATPILYGKNNIFGQFWWYFLGIYVTASLQMCLSNYIKGCNKTKLFALQGIIYTVSFLVMNILFLLVFSTGLPGYLVSIIFAEIIACSYMLCSTKCYQELSISNLDKVVLKEMLAYSAPLIPSFIAWYINSSADKYMILSFIGVGANGLYGIAHKIPTIFSSFSNLFSQAWRISAITTYDEQDKQSYYAKVYRMYSLICIYGCIILIIFSQFIAFILFQADYYQAWTLIPPLIIAALFEAYSGFLASIYAAANKTKFLSFSTCVGAMVNIVLNYVLILSIGTIGAPIATMLSFVVVWLMRLKVMDSFMPLRVNLFKQSASLLTVVIGGLYFSFQCPLMYIIGGLVILIVTIINKSDIKILCNFTSNIIGNMKCRCLGGKDNG